MKTTSWWVLAAVVAVGAVGSSPVATAAPAAAVAAPSGTAANAVAAQVNGEKIYSDDLDRMVAAIESNEPSLSSDTPEAKAALVSIRGKVLDDQIEHLLLVQEAKRRKLVVKTADIDEGVLKVRGPGVSDDDFKKSLVEAGKTMQDVRDMVSDELLVRQLTSRLTADLTLAAITPAEVLKAYNEHKSSFTVPPLAKAHHILLLVARGSSAADKAKVLARAKSIYKEAVAKPSEFETLARRYSQEPGAAESGGALGPFEREEMVKPFGDAVWSSKIGAIVGPIETEFGYHIIRVDERKPSIVMPVAKATEYIKPILLKQKMQERLEQQIKALRSAAHIVITN